MHALHYVSEILERQNVDVGRTARGGNSIDLGGFAELVHKKDLNRTISIRLEFELEDESLKDYLSDDKYVNTFEIRFEEDSAPLGDTDYQFTPVQSFWVELEVGFSHFIKQPNVTRYSTGINGKRLATLHYKPGSFYADIESINEEHEVFRVDSAPFGNPGGGISVNIATSAYARCGSQAPSSKLSNAPLQFKTNAIHGALPRLNEILEFPGLVPDPSMYESGTIIPRMTKKDQDEYEGQDAYVAGKVLMRLLTQYLVAPAEYARDFLKGIRYVGPLRTVPPANYYKPRVIEESRWADGMAVWDLLGTAGKEAFSYELSEWLSREDRLNTGYEMIVTSVREIDQKTQDWMMRTEWEQEDSSVEKEAIVDLDRIPVRKKVQLYDMPRDTYVCPNAVGIGISQVIPVIGAIVADGASLVQVEQPELHLHPTQQAALGDLLIAGVRQHNKLLFIETHSEHLILRLLRRIRETSKEMVPDAMLSLSPEDVAVLYLQSKNGQTRIRVIDVDNNGDFVQPWPDDFFDQDFHERFA